MSFCKVSFAANAKQLTEEAKCLKPTSSRGLIHTMGVAKITLPNTTRFAYFNWAVLPGRLVLGIPVSSHTYRSPSLGKTALKRLPKLQFHPQIANEEQISKPTVIEIQSLCRFKANESCVFNVSPIAKPWRGMTTREYPVSMRVCLYNMRSQFKHYNNRLRP